MADLNRPLLSETGEGLPQESLRGEVFDGATDRLPHSAVIRPSDVLSTGVDASEAQLKLGAGSHRVSGRAKGGKPTSFSIESSDFDTVSSFVNELEMAKKEPHHEFNKAACQWGLSALIGVATAGIAAAITLATRTLLEKKFEAVYYLIRESRESSTSFPWLAFAVYASINLGLALFAGSLVAFVEPVAAGSGISEIKSVLNGVKLPRVMRAKTLACKAVGVVASVSASLPCGKEGPMIHSGAIAAAGISQGKSTTMGLDTAWLREQLIDFRNDQEKRDFVSCGTSAGVAAAFGAPVGGVLFSLEEGSSFWSQELTWRSMFTAVVSSYTLNLILSGFVKGQRFGLLTEQGVFTFGTFEGTLQATAWRVEEIVLFVGMGALGGVIGAGFNALNVLLTKWRMANASAPGSRLLEVLAVSAVVTIATFLIPFLGECRAVPPTVAGGGGGNVTVGFEYGAGSGAVLPDESAGSDRANGVSAAAWMASNGTSSSITAQPDTVIEALVRFNCKEGQFNDLATMLLTPSEKAIRALFHALEGNVFESGWRLLVAFVAYSALTCLTYGIAVPSGLFIPSLLAGSFFGRLVALLLNHLLSEDPIGRPVLDEGTYSLIGAAAFLGGCVRMTISLAAILMESTGDVQYVLPIIVTLLSARVVGNLINGGIYDEHIELRKWPLLEESIGRHFHRLKVFDVMTSPVVTVTEVARVGSLLDAISKTSHHGFPVLFTPSRMARFPRLGTMAGIINRHHIAQILYHRAFHPRPPADILEAEAEHRRLLDEGLPTDTRGPSSARQGSLSPVSPRVQLALRERPSRGSSMSSGLVVGPGTAEQGASSGTGAAAPVPVGRALAKGRAQQSSSSINSGSEADEAARASAPRGVSLPVAGPRPLQRQHTSLSASSTAGEGEGADPFTSIPAAVADEPLGQEEEDLTGERDERQSSMQAEPLAGAAESKSLPQGSGTAKESKDGAKAGVAETSTHPPRPHGRAIASTTDLPPLHGGGGGIRTRPRSRSRHANTVSLAPGTGGHQDSWERARLGVVAVRGDPKVLHKRRRSGNTMGARGRVPSRSSDGSRGRGASGTGSGPRLSRGDSEAWETGMGAGSLLAAGGKGHGGSRSAGAGEPRWAQAQEAGAGAAVLSGREASQVLESPLESRGGATGASTGPTRPTARPRPIGVKPVGAGAVRPGLDADGRSRSGDLAAAHRTDGAGGRLAPGTATSPKLTVRGAAAREHHQQVLLEGFDYEGRPLLSWHDIEGPYPRFPQAAEIGRKLAKEDYRKFVDLRPYMNATPYTIHVRAPITRAYKLFRSIGLRHLVVVNDCADVVGILTRKDLTHSHLHKCYERKLEREEAVEVGSQEGEESGESLLPGARGDGALSP